MDSNSTSTYSRVIGTNPHAIWFIQHLGLSKKSFGRFRDVALYNDNGVYVVRVLTRNAGSNRQFLPKNKKLARHPLYLRQEIEPFDNTYLYFFFKIPPAMKKELDDGGVNLATAEESGDSWLVDNLDLKQKYESRVRETAQTA